MVEHLKDAEDRLLEAMFESKPLADDGFSGKVTARIRRRLWLRRLLLPVATAIGGAIAFKPLTSLLAAASNISTLIPGSLLQQVSGAIPPISTILLGAMLLGTCALGFRMFEE